MRSSNPIPCPLQKLLSSQFSMHFRFNVYALAVVRVSALFSWSGDFVYGHVYTCAYAC